MIEKYNEDMCLRLTISQCDHAQLVISTKLTPIRAWTARWGADGVNKSSSILPEIQRYTIRQKANLEKPLNTFLMHHNSTKPSNFPFTKDIQFLADVVWLPICSSSKGSGTISTTHTCFFRGDSSPSIRENSFLSRRVLALWQHWFPVPYKRRPFQARDRLS